MINIKTYIEISLKLKKREIFLKVFTPHLALEIMNLAEKISLFFNFKAYIILLDVVFSLFKNSLDLVQIGLAVLFSLVFF